MSRVVADVAVETREPAEGRSGLERAVVCFVCLAFLLIAFGGCRSGAARPEAKVDDRSIVARIRLLISENPSLSDTAVKVFAQEGRVTLSGAVPDSDTKARFLEQVKNVPGVKSVSDNLELPR